MTDRQPIHSLVIVGGGTAGWMVAAAAARFLNDGQRTITLIESDAIATIGVGEATIPPLRDFHELIGLDEALFVRETKATMKLGIEFVNWGRIGERYLHSFDQPGHNFQGVAFHQYWLKHRARADVGDLSDYCMGAQAIRHNRFAPPRADPRSPLSQFSYAYHFDAGLYAAHLRRRAEAEGVRRIEGRITGVQKDDRGDIASLTLEDGQQIAGEFFIDCSGFRSLLLGNALDVPYRDWSEWLVCDRAMAVPSARADPLRPMTRATALDAGWQWRIPLQHRTGNGIVYASDYLSDDEARATLLGNLEEEALAEARPIRFTTGVRERQWERNVIALGLAAGFVEPLESTAIHLIQTAISKLFWLFPDREVSEIERREFNRLMTESYEYVRDFIILHYKATARDDTPFWRRMANMDIPDSLAHKIELFREKGRIKRYEHDLFALPSWAMVMLGQNIVPRGYDTLVDAMDDAKVLGAMRQISQVMQRAAGELPRHEDYVAKLIG